MGRRTGIGLGLVALAGWGVIAACTGDDPAGATASDAAVDAPAAGAAPTLPGAKVVQVEAWNGGSCALYDDGTVWCWGDNTKGTVGARPPGNAYEPPTQVNGATNIKRISAGGYVVCALDGDGRVFCWGDDSHGALGTMPGTAGDAVCGDGSCSPVPRQIDRYFFTKVSVGTSYVCGITSNRKVLCWGYSYDAQCAVDLPSTQSVLPVAEIDGLVDMVDVGSGPAANTVCAVSADGGTWCWGKNSSGQLGHPPGAVGDDEYTVPGPSKTWRNPTPTRVALPSVVEARGGSTSCAITNDGRVLCFGNDNTGELGVSPEGGAHPAPVEVPNVTGAVHFTYGQSLCALLADGTLSCWGPGDLLASLPLCDVPSGTQGACHAPARLTDLTFQSFDLDGKHAVGLTTDGRVVSWGFNDVYGRVGHAPGTGGDDAGVEAGNWNPTPEDVVGLPGR